MVANRDVVSFLMDSLKRMEYRGYDSAGIAVRTAEQAQTDIARRRSEGKIVALTQVIAEQPISGQMGIGHIRWATHGEPTTANAHPHSSSDVTVVHNGIIENWRELKQELSNQGYVFSSQTDTEAIAYLIQSKLDQGMTALAAFQGALNRLEGAYAIAVMIKSETDKLYVARLGSPLIIGQGQGEMFAGSDALALATVTNKVCYLEEGDYAVLSTDSMSIYDKSHSPVKRPIVETQLSTDDAEKGEYPHFMLKEIHEQPAVVSGLIEQYIDKKTLTVKPLTVGFDPKTVERLAFIACGTAYHAGALGRYWIETLARLNVDIDVASEYRYRDLIQPKNGVFVAVSQSGETADTLAALRRAKAEGQHVLSVVNVASSSMARESDDVLLIHAGTEIGVASTKAFIGQIVVVLCLAIWLGRQRGVLSLEQEQEIIKGLINLPDLIQQSIDAVEPIQHIAYNISSASDVLFLGRGRSYPIALESALKLKEISYIHAEGYASGEMKHGAIALVEESVPVVCLCPNDEVMEKSLSNMQEVIARKAQAVLVADKATCQANPTLYQIVMPAVQPMVSPILYTVPMQLLSYYAALALGHDVDQPRNLAKSVTVE